MLSPGSWRRQSDFADDPASQKGLRQVGGSRKVWTGRWESLGSSWCSSGSWEGMTSKFSGLESWSSSTDGGTCPVLAPVRDARQAESMQTGSCKGWSEGMGRTGEAVEGGTCHGGQVWWCVAEVGTHPTWSAEVGWPWSQRQWHFS